MLLLKSLPRCAPKNWGMTWESRKIKRGSLSGLSFEIWLSRLYNNFRKDYMKKKNIIWLVFLVLVSRIVLASPQVKKGSFADMNLLLITLDTTRADGMGLYNNKNHITPNIDRLGPNSVIFENCYANVPLTLPAHCSIFTGRYPHVHQVRNNGTYKLNPSETTLAEIYSSHGFQTSAIIASFTVSSKFGLDQGFDNYDENFGSTEVLLNLKTEIPADQVYEKFLHWADDYDGQKFFLWVHFFDPHFPYIHHENISGGQTPTLWESYESEIRYVDTYVGKIMETLAAKGLMDNTIIVIAGDHGEAFGEHGEYGHGIFCYEESLKVPLIIHNPQYIQEKTIITENISLVDILPSLLELNNYAIPKNISGQSFVNLIQGKKEKKKRTIYFESVFGHEENNWAPPIGIVDNNFKYISLPEQELYDLKNDANETNNLFDNQRKFAGDMRSKLEQLMFDSAINNNPTKRKLSRSDIRKLESLGYLSSFSNQAKQTMDPKQGIIVYAQVEEIKSLLRQRRYKLAEEKYTQIISKNPKIEIPSIYQIAFQIEKSKGNTETAINTLQKALVQFPEHESLKIRLAREFFNTGKLSEAEELCRQILQLNDQMTHAHLLLGNVNLRLNKLEEALKNYEQAAALEPQNVMIKVNYASILMKNNELRKSLDLVNELGNEGNFINTSLYQEMIAELGNRFLATGKMKEAIPLLKKVIAFDPENPDAWLNLGSTYFGINQLDQALESFKKVLELNKDYAVAHSNIGLVYLSKYEADQKNSFLKQALDAFEKAIRLSPSLGDAYHGRALAKFSSGKNEEAVNDFAMAIELSPDLINAYFNISDVLRKMGNPSRAFEYLSLCKKRFYDRLSPSDQEGLDKLMTEVKNEIK